MPTRGRDLQRPSSLVLPGDIPQIPAHRNVPRRGEPCEFDQFRLTAQPVECGAQGGRPQYPDTGHQTRFRQGFLGHHHRFPARSSCREHRGQDSPDSPQPTVQGQFTQQDRAGQARRGHDIGGIQDRHGQCEVVDGSDLGQRGRGQREDHATVRPFLAGIGDGRPDPVPGFL